MEFEVIQKFMDDNREWGNGVFGNMAAISVLEHLRKEAGETIDAINVEVSDEDKRKTKFEFADMYLLLLNAASRYGLSFIEIHETAVEKMHINKTQREWGEPNEKGFIEHIKQNDNKNTEEIIVTEGWQKCPKCDGQGTVLKPPYLAGEIQHWTGSDTQHQCGVCKGKKIINSRTGLPPTELNNN